MQTLAKLHKYCFSIRNYANFYNGEFVPSKATQFYDIFNPVTQKLVARVPQSSQEEFNAIVASAKEGFQKWSRTPLLSKCAITQPAKGTCSIWCRSSEETIKSWQRSLRRSTERSCPMLWEMCKEASKWLSMLVEFLTSFKDKLSRIFLKESIHIHLEFPWVSWPVFVLLTSPLWFLSGCSPSPSLVATLLWWSLLKESLELLTTFLS